MSLDLPAELEALRDRFAHAWSEGAPRLEDFLPTAPGADRKTVLLQLALIDLEQRLNRGDLVRVESYLAHFPELAAPDLAVELIAAEYHLRLRREPDLAVAEYIVRFPNHAPALSIRLPRGPSSGTAVLTTRPEPARPDVSLTPATPAHLGGYEMLGELGRGGMGVVYKARDLVRGGLVALKTLPGVDPVALYRFKHEFRSLAGMAHENLAALYELAADGPVWFFTMELVEGTDFMSYVRGRAVSGQGPADLGRLRSAFGQLASALEALHRSGRLHRDVKPSNVRVTPAGRVVVLDFGLTAELGPGGRHQSTSGLLGTPAYMAPEQAAEQPVSTAADWYGVGVMLYQALTGQLPFQGSMLQVLRDKQEQDPPEPRLLVPQTPAALNDLCLGLLQRDPAARWAAAALHAWASQEGEPPAPDLRPAEPAATPFVGRGEHLEVLAGAYAAARQGRPVVAKVHGRSGVGKSALVQQLLGRLAAAGEAVVLAGRCYEQESVPYKALDSLVDALSRYLHRLGPLEVQALLPRDTAHLARLFPVLGQVEAVAHMPVPRESAPDPHELRRRAFAALRELLARLADRRPVILSIDDLQWGDLDSAALLREVLRPPEAPALLLVACYRSEDAAASQCLQAFLAVAETEVACVDLPVETLSEAEARKLAQTLLGGEDRSDLAQSIARESEGSPFFIYELVQHLEAAGPTPAAAPYGRTLPEVLWERVRRLPAEARRLIEVLAVAGRPLPLAEALAAAALEGPSYGALALLRSARYTRGTGSSERDTIETYHDRIRETVVGHLSQQERAEIHGRLARTLEAVGGADPEVLGTHFQGAGEPIKASHFYARAAAAAGETLAFDHSARLFRQALELHVPAGEQGRRLRAQLALALANAGRGAEAAREYLAAAPGAGRAEALDWKRHAADQLLRSGHIDEGLAVLREVLAEFGLAMPSSPRRALLGLLGQRAVLRLRGLRFRRRQERDIPPAELQRIDACWAAGLSLSITDTIRGVYFHTRHLLLALRAGEPSRIARGLALEAVHLAGTGNAGIRRAEPIFRAAEELAHQIQEPYARDFVLLVRGIAAGLFGNWRLAHDLCDRAEEGFRASCTGAAFEVDNAHRYSLRALVFRGAIGEVQRRLPRMLQEARERGNLYGETSITVVVPFLRLAEDDPAGARRELRESMERWSHQGFHAQHLISLIDEGQIDLYLGEPHAGWDRLCANWRVLRRSLLLRIQQLRIFLYHIHARTAVAVAGMVADLRPFLRAAEQDCRRLEREKNPWPVALGLLVRAGIAAVRGDRSRAAVTLRDAAGRMDALEMPLHCGAARRRLGELVGGEEGRALIEAADNELRQRGIVNPARMTAMLAPGFPDPG
jgi:hypothetical protein